MDRHDSPQAPDRGQDQESGPGVAPGALTSPRRRRPRPRNSLPQKKLLLFQSRLRDFDVCASDKA